MEIEQVLGLESKHLMDISIITFIYKMVKTHIYSTIWLSIKVILSEMWVIQADPVEHTCILKFGLQMELKLILMMFTQLYTTYHIVNNPISEKPIYIFDFTLLMR